VRDVRCSVDELRLEYSRLDRIANKETRRLVDMERWEEVRRCAVLLLHHAHVWTVDLTARTAAVCLRQSMQFQKNRAQKAVEVSEAHRKTSLQRFRAASILMMSMWYGRRGVRMHTPFGPALVRRLRLEDLVIEVGAPPLPPAPPLLLLLLLLVLHFPCLPHLPILLHCSS
jgi:hypothetical protein